MKKLKNKKRISIRSRIPFPPTKVLADIKNSAIRRLAEKRLAMLAKYN